MLNKAYESAKKSGFSVSITIVDKSGQTLAMVRDENAGVHTVRASYKKAYTAVSQKRESATILEGMNKGQIPQDIRFLDENFSVMPGGVPIVIKGVVVGGIGVGGAHLDDDVRIAKSGLSVIDDIK